ncbi:hypothetical protein [Lactococcus lactis]|uniref:hypothetical protein n=1 Tax=Lactococcus lactis TaxID=1358 RepID=UPI0001C052C5|nr:hypothetical protein [Lactococcus lactis]ADA65143.1 Phage protein [Lactococcus lactis subsp. lactis KF147]
MKPKVNDEYKNYKQFIDNYFSVFELNKRISDEKIKEEFEKVVVLSKVCRCLSDDEKIGNYTRNIEYNLNNILYFMPMNEKLSINTSLRNSAEYVLKLIFYFQDTTEDFLTTGYRTLKNNKNSLSIYSNHKSQIDGIFDIYARRSNIIHLKAYDNDSLKFILEDKLMSEIDIREISKITRDINKLTNILLEAICFYGISLATSQKLILKKVVSNKWWKRICQIR